jgi:hypothetical protein
MSTTSTLRLEDYTKNSIIVRGDFDTYGTLLKELKARHYKNIKGGEGWVVPIGNKDKVERLCVIKKIEEDKKDRKTQKKYHSAHSDDEDECDGKSDHECKSDDEDSCGECDSSEGSECDDTDNDFDSVSEYFEQYKKTPDYNDSSDSDTDGCEGDDENEN